MRINPKEFKKYTKDYTLNQEENPEDMSENNQYVDRVKLKINKIIDIFFNRWFVIACIVIYICIIIPGTEGLLLKQYKSYFVSLNNSVIKFATHIIVMAITYFVMKK